MEMLGRIAKVEELGCEFDKEAKEFKIRVVNKEEIKDAK